mmetsp:Transcript_50172/g.129123  ORF Transcript_50172/g.129123 Transcript_50172/m.129123 type:complete len:143 (-) Transcript_50172:374-802(-)|eukprot:CAMPEP_0113874902 /NCGR_PEP_ID=MMETSP0780_2-20120614/4613_1 /TAXON_ID=652834 /ORGANISM="Palpitomonas bilix" /LENGTH=142 /DNA_ID=CAMNT_0000860769 /DNA_START=270 /DNA_END=698 /DNA_ORIENTATION=+ /assembly_acc=CAM_ASM_000599
MASSSAKMDESCGGKAGDREDEQEVSMECETEELFSVDLGSHTLSLTQKRSREVVGGIWTRISDFLRSLPSWMRFLIAVVAAGMLKKLSKNEWFADGREWALEALMEGSKSRLGEGFFLLILRFLFSFLPRSFASPLLFLFQ